jgi:hypothetical protein
MNNEIIKPMSVERAEFIAAIANLIKNSKLPPFVIEPILEGVKNDVHVLAQRMLEMETKQYQEALKQYNTESSQSK